ncbi:hypothetical protein [Edaphobacter bradus]|uniref:hypothetical protein n=1 Tax=Edaphobacter bradus TaxID=2259016 RepID=UPI0021E06297|nr:hypothetical protein [Edaphobacter bradus]
MKTRCGPRLPRRLRRPAPLPATRSQIRQKVEQIRACYQVEAILELSQMDPNVDHLARLDKEARLLDEFLASLEEQI